MGKEAKTNAMRILEREKVPYPAHEYAHEEGVPLAGVVVEETVVVNGVARKVRKVQLVLDATTMINLQAGKAYIAAVTRK